VGAGGERVWPLPFGERLSLRAARYGGEGLPSALVRTPEGAEEAPLWLEVTPRGLSLVVGGAERGAGGGAALTLTPGQRLPWRGGHLELSTPLLASPSEPREVDPLDHGLLGLLALPRWALGLLLALVLGALAVLLGALGGQGGL